MKIGILGAGAAGFFGAIQAAQANPNAEVILLEKSTKILAKVLISGGGRCNVTHHCLDNARLVQHYPRGAKELRSAFERFSVNDTIAWFATQGVTLKTEADGRMFPDTNKSETIIQALTEAAKLAKVKIYTNLQQIKVHYLAPGFNVQDKDGNSFIFDKILIATGGAPQIENFKWLQALGHDIIPPVPSLFTFNLKQHPLAHLSGISVEKAEVKILGTKLIQQGPLLITHWGLSGPVILRLSAWGARTLHDLNYFFDVSINWLPEFKEESLRAYLEKFKIENNKKLIGTQSPFREIPSRLWKWMYEQAGITDQLKWADISKKQNNILIEILLRNTLKVDGKSTFKEEFVTAGGISLKDVDFKTMESKKCKGMYFAGEVLDIDAITGGFNFQAAWTTSYIAGNSMGTN